MLSITSSIQHIIVVNLQCITIWLYYVDHNLTRELIEYQLEEWSRTSTLQDACWAAQTELRTPAWVSASNYAQYDRKQKASLHLLLHSIEHSHLKLENSTPAQSHNRLTKATSNWIIYQSETNSPLGISSPRYCLIKARTCALLRSYSFASTKSNLRRFSKSRLK